MKKHKIHVNQVSTLTRWGGVERMMVDFLTQTQHLDAVAYSLLTTSSNPDILAEIPSTIKHFQPKRSFHYDPWAIYQMVKWYKQHTPDVVHTHNLVPNVWGGIAAQLARVPRIIGGERGTIYSQQGLMHLLNKLVYRKVHHIVVNSVATKTIAALRYGVDLTQISVVYNMVPDFEKMEPQLARQKLGVEAHDFVVGSIGRLVSQKNYTVFVKACALVAQIVPNAKFVLIGGGPQQDYLETLVKQFALQEKFKFLGWRSDARELLQAFDVFVSTSISEPFGNVLVEAGLSSKAIIAPAVDGIVEVVVNGQTGILIEPTITLSPLEQDKLPKYVIINGEISPPKSLDSQQLADAIINLAQDTDKRHYLGQNGRQYVTEKFSFEQYANRLQQIYFS